MGSDLGGNGFRSSCESFALVFLYLSRDPADQLVNTLRAIAHGQCFSNEVSESCMHGIPTNACPTAVSSPQRLHPRISVSAASVVPP